MAFRLAASLFVPLVLAACATDPRASAVPETTGTLVGSVAPMAEGAESAEAERALLGDQLMAALEGEDRRRAFAAQMQALESGAAGAPVAWRNPATGRYGSIVPGAATEGANGRCRAFTHTVTIDRKPLASRGSACRGGEGGWTRTG